MVDKSSTEEQNDNFEKHTLSNRVFGLRVLSLFDGMSCGQQALERIGVNVLEYYASEIDKYAIEVTMNNYPNTKQLGSVVNIDGYKLPKIDLLIGGSPCQSFSFAGKRKGMSTKCETEILTLEQYLELKTEGYEFEGQSYLFWEYMRLLNECKPKYFLLENVMMGEKWEKVLSKAIGVNAIEINSALVSAQNRRRLYWTNIGMKPMGLFGDMQTIIEQPKDKGILLKDILEDNVNEKYFLSEKAIDYINRDKRNLAFQMNEDDNKSGCITAVFHKQIPYNQIIVHNTMPIDNISINDDKAYCLDKRNTNSLEIILTSKDKRLKQTIDGNNLKNGTVKALDTYNQSIHDRYPTLKDPKHNDRALFDGSRIRRLTPKECMRLQTVDENYLMPVSDSQRYKMLGNGWTISVISHIFSYLPKEYFEINE
jgi:DNA (cytosine-5)-methyltransferase 3A